MSPQSCIWFCRHCLSAATLPGGTHAVFHIACNLFQVPTHPMPFLPIPSATASLFLASLFLAHDLLDMQVWRVTARALFTAQTLLLCLVWQPPMPCTPHHLQIQLHLIYTHMLKQCSTLSKVCFCFWVPMLPWHGGKKKITVRHHNGSL